jgi:hypothetical protein
MANKKKAAELVRASRDGHEYHEIWVARRAMQLLWPDCKLAAIAVEGTAPTDQTKVSKETLDIADMTLYYGDPGFEKATRTTYSQVKYSIAYKTRQFRVADAKKTMSSDIRN